MSIDSPDPAYAAITVADNGPGIAPEIAARLFEPYATTKPQGTGLGLAIAQRIAIEHQGELSLLPHARGQGRDVPAWSSPWPGPIGRPG